MTLYQTAAVIFCVCLISTGQVLFKIVGLMSARPTGIFHPPTLLVAAGAFAIYGVATLIWIYLLRSIELAKAYPFMALSFLFVPVAAAIFFGERVSYPYFAGVALVMLGIAVIGRFG